MSVIGIIPSRYDSGRFPGKPLVDIAGKSMIQRVFEQARKATSLKHVYVATDDKRILNHVKDFGGNAILTSIDHKSGTDRCAEAIDLVRKELKTEIIEHVVNIQGDEPFIHPSQINTLVRHIQKKRSAIATLVKVIEKDEDLFNPNVVKVVLNTKNYALYFSRSAIPYLRDKEQAGIRFYKHIGLYAFTAGTLHQLAGLSATGNELAESLEQLRWIDHGYSISVAFTDKETLGIDVPEDIEKARKYIRD